MPHNDSVFPAAFDAYRARVEASSGWPDVPARKRLIFCTVLAVECAGLCFLLGWAIHRIDPDPAAPYVALSFCAPLPYALLQLAFWPRGALARSIAFFPVWYCIWFIGMVITAFLSH